ncbi:MAG: SpoIIE family protein phosphatase [Selenomonadaceae bacterium]|nr:SpoIIE family protein phosphatase [Selenomonadaceae bacterium]
MKGRTSIARQIFALMLLTGLVCFVAFETVSFVGLYEVQTHALENGREMGLSAAGFAESVADEQAKKRFSLLAREKALHIDAEMARLKEDTELLAREMTHILTHRELYRPRRLPIGGEVPIASGEPYLFFLRSLRESEGVAAVLPEVDIAANTADMLSLWVDCYDNGHEMTCFYVSEQGYLISADLMPDGKEYVDFHEEWFSAGFDPRQRPWYKEVKETGKTVFTDLYVGIEGYLAISCVAPYYDEQGFAGMAGMANNVVSLYRQIEESGLGEETRVNFILNRNGEIILSSKKNGMLAASDHPVDLRRSAKRELAAVAKKMVRGQSGVSLVTLDDNEYYLAYAPVEYVGWSFGTLIDRDLVVQPAQEAREHLLSRAADFSASLQEFFWEDLLRTAAMLAVLLALLFFASRRLSRRFSRPILMLSDGVREIAGGNLDKKLDIRTGDEIEHLAVCFNDMTGELKTYMENLARATAERERVQAELSIAAAIQAGMLPKEFPNHGAFDIYATMHPARNVGGDFYDFYMLDENHLAVTIADVSGKGVGAAIFMSRSMTILKNFAVMMQKPDDLAGVMSCANNQLCQGNEENMFVTVFMGLLDTATGKFIYVSGGHNPPLLRHGETGICEYLPLADSCMLGMMEDIPFVNRQLTLKPGDMLFLYTDGVTEAMNSEQDLFREGRLKEVLEAEPREAAAEEALSAVAAAVRNHAGDTEQSDDITMLGLKYLAKS